MKAGRFSSQALLIAGGTAVLAVIAAAVYFLSPAQRMKKLPESDLFSQGQIAAAKGDCGSAIRFYETLLSKDPRHYAALDFMIDCQVKLKDWSQAIRSSERLLELDPNRAKHRYRLAYIYRMSGDAKKAEEMQKSAAEAEKGAQQSAAPAGVPSPKALPKKR